MVVSAQFFGVLDKRLIWRGGLSIEEVPFIYLMVVGDLYSLADKKKALLRQRMDRVKQLI